MIGFTDSDWAGSLDDRKNISGYVLSIGSKLIAWSFMKQKTVALSSSEIEYIVPTEAACEADWLWRILSNLQEEQVHCTTIFSDNLSTIAMTKNPVFHARFKHIELRHYFIRDLVSKGEFSIEFVDNNDQATDFLTKAVKIKKIEKFKKMMKIITKRGC